MTAQTTQATTAYALHAITQHMLDHGLPAPWRIHANLTRGAGIIISVNQGAELTMWLDSLLVLDETSFTRDHCRHTEYAVSVASLLGDVRFTVTTAVMVEGLALVPGNAS